MGVGPHGTNTLGRALALEGLPAREARIDLVPEAHFLLPQLPAKVDFPSLPDGGEINEPTLQIFDVTTLSAYLGRKTLHASHELEVAEIDWNAATNEDVLKLGRVVIRGCLQAPIDRAEPLQPLGEERDQLVGFQDCKEALIHSSKSLAKMNETDKLQEGYPVFFGGTFSLCYNLKDLIVPPSRAIPLRGVA